MGIFGKKKQPMYDGPTAEDCANHSKFTRALMEDVNRGYASVDPGPDYPIERTQEALELLTWYALAAGDKYVLTMLKRIAVTYTITNPYEPDQNEFWGKFLFENASGIMEHRAQLIASGNQSLADDVTAFSTPALHILELSPHMDAVMGAMLAYAHQLSADRKD